MDINDMADIHEFVQKIARLTDPAYLKQHPKKEDFEKGLLDELSFLLVTLEEVQCASLYVHTNLDALYDSAQQKHLPIYEEIVQEGEM